jgi:hypothetical protein
MSFKKHFYSIKNKKVIFILNEPFCGIEYLINNMKSLITQVNFDIINKENYEIDIIKRYIENLYEKTSDNNM